MTAADAKPLARVGTGPAPSGSIWERLSLDTLYKVVFAVCLVAGVLPFWAGEILPFRDYAGNMTYAVVLANSEPGSLYARYYETGGLLYPNGLFLWLWAWLGEPLGYDVAGKLLYSVFAVLLPISVDRLLVTAGRQRYWAMLSFPLVFNASVVMGFVGYATALPILVYAVTLSLRNQAEPTLRRAAGVAIATIFVWLGHAQMYLVLGLVVVAMIIAIPRSWRELWRLILPYAPSLLLFLPWLYTQFVAPPDPSALGGEHLYMKFTHPGQIFSDLGQNVIARWTAAFDDWVFIVMFALVFYGLIHRRDDWRPPFPSRSRRPLEWIAAVIFLGYAAAPEHTQVQAVIASRLVPVGFVFVLGWLSLPRGPFLKRGLTTFMGVLAVVFFWQVAKQIDSYNRNEVGEGYLAMIEAIPDGAALATVTEYEPSWHTIARPHEHPYGYHYALNKGIAWSGFHRYYGRHVWWRDMEFLPRPPRRASKFLGDPAACAYDFVLFHTKDPPHFRRLNHRLTYVAHSGRYTLWRVEHDRIPRCRHLDEEGPDRDEAADESPEEREAAPHPRVLHPIPARLVPGVGSARGRDIHGRVATEPTSTRTKHHRARHRAPVRVKKPE